MAPAAPKSPKLRLEGLHPNGIDVTWQTPQQSGDAHISVNNSYFKRLRVCNNIIKTYDITNYKMLKLVTAQ